MGVRILIASGVCLAGLAACGGNASSSGSSGGRAAGGSGGVIQGTGGRANGGGGASGAAAMCSEQSPAGCVVNACPPSYRCDVTVGCRPSKCVCVDGGWACDDDCGGGTCVPVETPEPTACETVAAQLATEIGVEAQSGSCTAVVRLDYGSLAVLGHTFVCGPYGGGGGGGEAAARARADADATFPSAGSAGQGRLLLNPQMGGGGEWIFYQTPSDFGGAAAVGSRNGLTVFAGSIVWAGTGKLLVPSQWRTTDIGRGCPTRMVSARGFDLRSGVEFENGEWNAAAQVVLTSAIPSAMETFGGVFDAVVLLYPRTVGVFEPTRAEYVVLLNGGALIGD